ncbi:MAG TPA: sodium-dependent transporter [Halieaceae bacterium]|jgi:NSS family neurotransmitter:Na+ symporter|uniref:Sodium-dependent transporter n=1 Tax=Haliea salexigens TaxID=287487 RepID=A0A3C1KJ83_9GAMM|nr:sodium-dependent transporter [Haliea sp.]HAN26651.1 sodium-dependent transporter [Haliea salexigens]HAN67770.1 sodium-dependent transporter [Halieaceae bacterium]MAD62759.1 sodium-dependent transporter [Haliea sp.]MAD62997.1 sodium-dependent transporter [Haliea sp.]MAY91615.1 sodium-dependent transporter [Haliea sp.]|tara:strand:- start:2706 stop:4058 length:1353 start_codon:yes stop_codon:yes gene_type:complete
MASSRGEFSSRFGFIMAAAGSAVGLGNIWGFPTQAASNGGAAFLLVYLFLAFTLAYPALMAELIIGRHAHANAVRALRLISPNTLLRNVGTGTGIAGLIVASFILSFYAIVAGWMLAHCLAALTDLAGMAAASAWLTDFSLARNLAFMLVFMALTIGIISEGVQQGIERWSSRLMPLLLLSLVLLVVYVLTLDGALDGLRVYLLPDFERALAPGLIVKALGAAFFSLSLGVGTMLIYGSYISDSENLPVVGGLVTLVDISIAVLAGFLVLPAMYVALHSGVEIFTASGALISEDTLIFTVLPKLFDTMGVAGVVVSLLFFFLMTIAALTSSISMLEVPVAYTIEEHGVGRKPAVLAIGSVIALISTVILLNFETLFGLVIAVTTRYSQPLLGFMFCLYAGWVWHRDTLLQELRKGDAGAEHKLFWKIWPGYVRVVCPLIILLIFAQSLVG